MNRRRKKNKQDKRYRRERMRGETESNQIHEKRCRTRLKVRQNGVTRLTKEWKVKRRKIRMKTNLNEI